jgi:hypothetical protein
MTKSPRLIVIEFGDGFDPQKCVVLAVKVQLCNLRRNPAAHGLRARIGYNEAQFAQAPPSAPRAHHPHSFGGLSHIFLCAQCVTHVTRYDIEQQ